MKVGGYLLCALSGLGIALPAHAEILTDLSLGYRQDYLRWNIAADLSGQTTPNIGWWACF